MMLAKALFPLVSKGEDLGRGLEKYRTTLSETHYAMMLKKLGLTSLAGEEENDATLLEGLHEALVDSAIDMTLFFRNLAHAVAELSPSQSQDDVLFGRLIKTTSYLDASDAGHQRLQQWLSNYAERVRKEPAPVESIREEMLRANPKYVLRNYLAQKAIEGADAGDLSFLQTLMEVLKTPYAEQPEHDELAAKRPEWAREKPGCATLSCSS
jgi:uncharacterized protein YdiU (UPF0061 family)